MLESPNNLMICVDLLKVLQQVVECTKSLLSENGYEFNPMIEGNSLERYVEGWVDDIERDIEEKVNK